MATITFEVIPKSNEGYLYDEVSISIDGVDLITLLKDVEAPFAIAEGSPEIAGSYAYLSLGEAVKAYRPSSAKHDNNDRVAVLECECGIAGCWPLMARITVSAAQVTWSRFEQAHRSGDARWDYSSFGPFSFNRDDYEASAPTSE